MTRYDLKGRTAGVTGATGAIGSAVVRALVEGGAGVAVIARGRRRLERLRGRLPDDARVVVCPADVTSAYELVEARERVHRELGAPDLVVTAAGVRRAALFEDAVPADWNLMLNPKGRGTLQAVQIFAHDVLAAGEAGDRADIVTFATAPAHERQQAYSVFSSFGAALSQFSKHLRAEYGPRGVRVHHIESLYTAGSFFTHGNLGADRSTSAHHDVLPDDIEYIEPIGTQHLASEVAFMVSLPAHVNFANAVVQPTRSH